MRELLEGVRRDRESHPDSEFGAKRLRPVDRGGEGGGIQGRKPVPDGVPSSPPERPRPDLGALKTVVPYFLGTIVVIVAVIVGAYKAAPGAVPVILGVCIPLVVIVLVFAGAFAGVFKEETTERIIRLVLRRGSADSKAGAAKGGQAKPENSDSLN